MEDGGGLWMKVGGSVSLQEGLWERESDFVV